jgi:hypothetical protein
MARLRTITVMLAVLAITGCASRHTASVPVPAAVMTPSPDKATVVFLRPGNMGFSIPSSVFDLSADPPIPIALLWRHEKLAYRADPGKRRFMVIGETADFLDADLVGGKIYYVRVTKHMGMVEARYSLDPITQPDVAAGLARDLKDIGSPESTQEVTAWASHHIASIQAKKAQALPEWEAKRDRPTLHAEDGM